MTNLHDDVIVESGWAERVPPHSPCPADAQGLVDAQRELHPDPLRDLLCVRVLAVCELHGGEPGH